MLALLFLFNLVWQLPWRRKDIAANRNPGAKFERALSAMFSKGGTNMRTIPRSISLAMVALLLSILTFPTGLYASDFSRMRQSLIAGQVHSHSVVVPKGTPSTAFVNSSPHRDNTVLRDADFRLRGAAVLVGNPIIRKRAQNEPLRLIVITANLLADV